MAWFLELSEVQNCKSVLENFHMVSTLVYKRSTENNLLTYLVDSYKFPLLFS